MLYRTPSFMRPNNIHYTWEVSAVLPTGLPTPYVLQLRTLVLQNLPPMSGTNSSASVAEHQASPLDSHLLSASPSPSPGSYHIAASNQMRFFFLCCNNCTPT